MPDDVDSHIRHTRNELVHQPFLISAIIVFDDDLIIILIGIDQYRDELSITAFLNMIGFSDDTIDDDRLKPVLEGEGVIGGDAQIFRKMCIWIDAFAQLVELFCQIVNHLTDGG